MAASGRLAIASNARNAIKPATDDAAAPQCRTAEKTSSMCRETVVCCFMFVVHIIRVFVMLLFVMVAAVIAEYIQLRIGKFEGSAQADSYV